MNSFAPKLYRKPLNMSNITKEHSLMRKLWDLILRIS